MLSKKTKYALHALTYLGKIELSKPTLIADISKDCKIPKKFLETILLELKQATILGSKMGKGGGYFLRIKPSEINFRRSISLTQPYFGDSANGTSAAKTTGSRPSPS